MIRRPPRSTPQQSSAASDVYKRQLTNTTTSRADQQEYMSFNCFICTWNLLSTNMHNTHFFYTLVFNELTRAVGCTLWACSHGNPGHDSTHRQVLRVPTCSHDWSEPELSLSIILGHVIGRTSSADHFRLSQPKWCQSMCACGQHLHYICTCSRKATETIWKTIFEEGCSQFYLLEPF